MTPPKQLAPGVQARSSDFTGLATPSKFVLHSAHDHLNQLPWQSFPHSDFNVCGLDGQRDRSTRWTPYCLESSKLWVESGSESQDRWQNCGERCPGPQLRSFHPGRHVFTVSAAPSAYSYEPTSTSINVHPGESYVFMAMWQDQYRVVLRATELTATQMAQLRSY